MPKENIQKNVDKTKIRKLLSSLGRTEKKVAESLANKGIKGWRGDCNWCPLANLVRGEVSGDLYISIQLHEVEFRPEIYAKPICKIKLTKACQEFIKEFDDGYHPELVGRNG